MLTEAATCPLHYTYAGLLSYLLKMIYPVPQDPLEMNDTFIFHTTLFQNVRY